jgi:hypothetical protein
MIIPLIKCNQRTPAMHSKYSVTFLSDHAPLNIPYVFIGWRPVKALAKKKTFLTINKMSKKQNITHFPSLNWNRRTTVQATFLTKIA